MNAISNFETAQQAIYFAHVESDENKSSVIWDLADLVLGGNEIVYGSKEDDEYIDLTMVVEELQLADIDAECDYDENSGEAKPPHILNQFTLSVAAKTAEEREINGAAALSRIHDHAETLIKIHYNEIIQSMADSLNYDEQNHYDQAA